MEKYDIYIGLTDLKTNKEILSPEAFANELHTYCTRKKVSFSMVKQLGGCFHSQGYVTETSLRITVIGISEYELINLCSSIKRIANTDLVMVTKEETNCYYV